MRFTGFVLLTVGLALAACNHGEPPSSPRPTTQSSGLPAETPPPIAHRPTETRPPMVMNTPSFDVSYLGTVLRDQPYCTIPEGVDLLMDVYYPAQGKAPFPTVLYVHGGSWTAGSKAEGQLIPYRTDLVEGGNVFVSINYRLAPAYRFPAQIEDVKCAVRSLRANADRWGIDPERIAAMGSSAGGHLVALLGTADESAGWDTSCCFTDQSSRVKAVVDLFGPAVPEGTISAQSSDLLNEVFGATGLTDPILVKASPVTYITQDDPPFLIIHGTKDTTVPLHQSERLAELLHQGGVQAKLVVVENGGHGIPTPGMNAKPGFPEIMQTVRGFLEEAIGRG